MHGKDTLLNTDTLYKYFMSAKDEKEKIDRLKTFLIASRGVRKNSILHLN